MPRFLALLAVLAAACGKQRTGPPISWQPLADRAASSSPHFRRLDAAVSGLMFGNELRQQHVLPYIYAGAGTAIGDYDGDGLPDIYLVSQDGPNKLFRQHGPLRFQDVTVAAGGLDGGAAWGSAASFADLDGDGWLDLLKRQMAGPPVIYKARCGEAAAVTVRLAGTQPNPYGVGARIEVEAGGVTQTRWIHAGESLSSSAPYMAHVGLADATTIDRLTITWSDGTVAAFEDLDVNEHIEVRHPQGASRLPFGG